MKSIYVFYLIIFFFLGCNRETEKKDIWYPFRPEEDFSGSSIDMSDWLDKPAGKHGFVKVVDDKLVFEDATPVKFWGTNICSARPYSDNETVDKWVRFITKYGMNGIRFHKFTYHGFTGDVSTKIDSGLFDNFDYFQNALRENGIYYGWSPIYGHKPRPGDSTKLIAYQEIVHADMDSHLSYSTIGLVNFSEDLQNLHIELIMNMLRHKNPYSGKRYADDPALSFIELQNEDNIFFATTDRMLKLCPTYKKQLTQKFTRWLVKKYGNHQGLMDAWGKEAIDWGKEVRGVEWNLNERNICPVASHGIYDYEYNKYADKDTTMPRFLLDMARFLYEQQMNFYNRFKDSVRSTGYRGPVIGSCWQAGSGPTHYYNLHTDYKMGIIDRHNYFGGGTGHRLVPGRFKNNAMVSKPGSGQLSTGIQQVKDRPFALSEWMNLPPNEWIAEGAPIVACYGLGLQGWDASYSFAMDNQEFTNTIHTPGVYNVTSPTQMALYPALVSTLYNGDLKEGRLIHQKNVLIKDLIYGKLGFRDKIKQDRDQKVFEGEIPIEALAVGRIAVNFTRKFQETSTPDISEYLDTLKKQVKSTTGQLFWDFSGQGYMTVNTPSLKGFVGFTDKSTHELNEISIRVLTPFAVVLVSSLEKGKALLETGKILITTVARAKNSGMKYDDNKTKLIEVGEAPILMEPVDVELIFNYRTPKEIYILDHVGRRTGNQIPVKAKKIKISGKKYNTLYYEMVF